MDNSKDTPALAKPQPQSPALATGMMTGQCEAATLKQGKAELGACLTLVSPSGLSADDRKEWLAVAMQTLSGIPADLLRDGCETARRKCRFPSEIVPTILEDIKQRWKWRKEDARRGSPRLQSVPSLPQPEPEYVDPAEVRKLLDSLNGGAVV